MTRTPARAEHPAINPDLMTYFVQVDFGGEIGRSWVERDPARMDRESTVEDISKGEWGKGVKVVKVLECCEGSADAICFDRTEDILNECLTANFIALGEKFFADEIAPRTGQDKIDWQHDHERALKRETV